MVEKISTPYDAIGDETLSQLVDAFYRRVGQHPDLSPIFPNDLTETARKQKQFLTQYLGGPPLYTLEHGHPMLRARHLPFEITKERAESWLSCMKLAMDEIGLHGPIREHLFSRLVLTANHMINSNETEMTKGENT
ncbi:globin [Bacillus sp. 03113]|uniref:globin domain-containing protein n=1 Tax=Bacillus sp. 03113 TaxID=2578211 RepID=UPI00114341E1|nr:globin [Bacillus sp. 03113]